MFAFIIVFVVAVALVTTYLLIVNRFLRSDEHWNEDGPPVATVSRARPAASADRAGSASYTPNHA